MKLFFLSLFFVVGLAQAAETQVTAEFDPSQISLGESTQLRVTVSGSSAGAPTLPEVAGLAFTPVGQTSNFSFINGALSSNKTYLYMVAADRIGTYPIPAIAVGNAKSNPVTLVVMQAAPRQTQAAAVPSAGASPAASGTAPTFFLQVLTPKRDFYVGEMVPVEIRACFLDGVQANLDSAPALEGDTFTLNPITTQPGRSSATIEGHRYNVLSWHSTLSAVKAGDVTLAMTMPATLLLQQRRAHPATGDALNDSFFDGFFQNVTRKDVELRSVPQPIRVLPIPTEGRPVDFSGAIGDFSIAAEADPRQITEGDPITLRVEIRGHGNLERAQPRLLSGVEGWKTYPPSSKVEGQDGAGFEGVKKIEEAVIPIGSGAREIPAMPLTFFDPDTRKFVTRSTEPIPIAIAPAPAAAAGTSAVPVPSAPVPAAEAQAAPSGSPATDLAPNKIDAGVFVSTLRPVFLDPWFFAGPILPLLPLLIGTIWVRRRKKLENDPKLARRRNADRAVATQLEILDRAARDGNMILFFDAARTALRHRLGERWNLPPGAITLAEIESRGGFSDGVRAIFRRADEVAYSGLRFEPEDYATWRERLMMELKAFDKK